ncbi:hypothetical protein CERZMDRAFT_37748 [Cercospora zeae-maydis SCOH1-5]|uniref:Methyltransferase domain-containing protein n=1 Tax=Cercospora zeae-maydis SCOH1-5 TaxID=717836 RepID=A0A6A6FLI5_9PEZI|nr:hypothetical protein CERZMDRAFT_37748 [Cercospora zeae-maydis SCOH1-5]
MAISSDVQHGANPANDKQRIPTYHDHDKAGYALPNDSAEHHRLDRQAGHLSAMMLGNVPHAPVQSGKSNRMLDVGCGTGAITNLIASFYPDAECIGLDLTPVPATRPHRANTQFFQGDFCSNPPSLWTPITGDSSLPKSPHLFDYIFSRLLIAGMTKWPEFITKLFSLLRPGGWAEVQDLDFHWYDENNTPISQDWKWLDKLVEVCEKKEMDLRCGSKVHGWVNDAGFADVQTFEYS